MTTQVSSIDQRVKQQLRHYRRARWFNNLVCGPVLIVAILSLLLGTNLTTLHGTSPEAGFGSTVKQVVTVVILGDSIKATTKP